MIKFKLVNENDLEILKDIAIKAFEDDLRKYGSMPPGIESIEWHKDKLNDGHYYKILMDNEIIGAMKIYDKGNGHFHLGSIFIAPLFQNQGIGSKAMFFLDKNFKEGTRWTLDTPYKNYRNHYFYEKHGFKKVKAFKPEPNNSFTLYIFEKNYNPLQKEISMIKNVEKFTAIVARKKLKIREIFKFSEESYPKMLASIEENRLKIVGKPTFISYGRDGSLDKSFEHEICIPVAKSDDYNGPFEIKEYQSFKCVAKRFDGTINQILKKGIPEVLNEAKEKNENLTNEMREVYYEWHKPRSRKNVIELQFGLE